MFQKRFLKFILVIMAVSAAGCERNIFQSPTVAPASLRDVPALRLNFRFEPDVPAPAETTAPKEERNAAVQNDFDTNRSLEILYATLTSPDKQRVLAVYQKLQDFPSEYRLDMYAPDGKILRKITSDGMAVHFPDTIVWSPDSTTVAFVAMVRAGQQTGAVPEPSPGQTEPENPTKPESNINTETDANTENTNADSNTVTAVQPTPFVEEAKAVLTLRTEQIYTCGSDGGDVKLLTQNEGLIYFYYVWSPDSSMLAALAATFQEWRYLQLQADKNSEVLVPLGRPRIVEKNGRERRLDDNLTAVHPVWSPDSAKVAAAFDKQVRIYDAIGNNPTQAAIPLRNQLLISSKAFDEAERRKEEGSSAPADNSANAAPPDANVTTLPDESTLVSFNPIINLEWPEDKMLYLQTGYVKLFKESANNVRSFLRWHRLILSPQAVALGNQN